MSQTTKPSLDRTGTIPHLRKPMVVFAPASRTASHRRTARAAIAWALAAFVLVNVTLPVAVETSYPKLRDPEYGYRLPHIHAQQQAHPDRPLVLVLGTSRVQNGINPSAMNFPDEPGSPLVFNFGQSAASPLRQWLTLQRLEDEGIRPGAVVIEIFAPSLGIPGPEDEGYNPADTFENELARFTHSDLARMEPYLRDPAAFRRRWLAERVNSLQTQQTVILSHIAPEWQPWGMRVDHNWTMLDECGFNCYPALAADEKRPHRLEKVRDQYCKELGVIHVSKLSERVHRDVASHCRARGIPVAFVMMPESPTFQGWYSPKSRQALAEYVRVLKEEVGCPVFASSEAYTEDDFADGHHMLSSGANRFSAELAEKQLKPWLRIVGQASGLP